ncbi:unnamed protein product [Blepharisma stoltei]|uniref:Uncharacterized protein n=1 Tax=Blepharisma stoltei TaxID=1481888 RepID=A0AAU9JVX5_9CILI|nr:unnamed protein product [Blepharisma stoltei]
MKRYIPKQETVATDRSLNLSRLDTFEQEHSIDQPDFTIYDSFSFSKKSAAKRFQERKQVQIRSPKKNYLFKNPTSFEYEKLLAISEIRYIQMFEQLKRALIRNKKIMCMNIIYAIMKFKPLVFAGYRMILRTNLRKWKCNIVLRKQKQRKPNTLREKISGFLIQWRRIHRRNLVSAFLIFRERGIQNAMIKSRRTSDNPFSVNNTRSQMTPSPNSRVQMTPSSNSSKSMRMTPSTVKSSAKLDESTKKEFKKAIKGKFKDEEQVISRPGGLMRYFR